MTCEQVETSLADYFDGSFSGDGVHHLRRHLACCARCGQLAREYDEVRRLAAALPVYAPSLAAERRIRAGVDAALQDPNVKPAHGLQAPPRSRPSAS